MIWATLCLKPTSNFLYVENKTRVLYHNFQGTDSLIPDHLSVWSFSHVQFLCDPVDHSPPGSSFHGILQARILEQAAIPRGSSQPRAQTCVSCIASRVFTVWVTWETQPPLLPYEIATLTPNAPAKLVLFSFSLYMLISLSPASLWKLNAELVMLFFHFFTDLPLSEASGFKYKGHLLREAFQYVSCQITLCYFPC